MHLMPMRPAIFVGLFAWAAACSSSSENTETVCKPKITQSCAIGACPGIQTCLDDGSDWSPCQCTGTGGTGGAPGGTGGGAGTGGTATGGVGGGEPDGSSGSAGQTNVDAGNACTALACAERVGCCEADQFPGSEVLESFLETKCGSVSIPSCTDICFTKDGSLEEVVTCLVDIRAEKPLVFGQIIDECDNGVLCANIVDCLGDCL
jgi:hypothetical protein